MEIVLNENEIAKRETIDFSKTFANQLYARPIRLKNIKKIKTNFEFDLLGSIIVHKNKTDDNTYERLFDQLGIDINPINNMYEILDGQHRIKAMQELFGEKVEFEVVVLENMAYEERVKYYHTYNEDRQSLTYGEKFKARIEMQDPDALAVHRIAKDNHLLLAGIDVPTPSRVKFGVCMAISTLNRVYNSGYLNLTLKVLYNAYKDTPLKHSAQAYGNLSLRHVDIVLKTYTTIVTEGDLVLRDTSNLDLQRLIEVLGKLDSYILNSESNIDADKNVKAKIVPMKIVELYNKNLRVDKKLDSAKLLLPLPTNFLGRDKIKG